MEKVKTYNRKMQPKKRQVIFPKREELAWAAGFYDGEGCTHSCANYRNGQRDRVYPQVSLAQAGMLGYELLERFDKAVGRIGKVKGPYHSARPKESPYWHWDANGFQKTQAVMAMLWPWLGTVKRNQFMRLIRAYLEQREWKF